MEIKNLLEIGITIFGTSLLIVVLIILISIFIKNDRIQNTISAIQVWFTNHNSSLGELLQSIISILALLVAIYALSTDSLRDNESSKRYSKSVNREKEQHVEIMKVYQKQTSLISKYSESADSMLELLRMQSLIADQQFENQILLTQPGLNINFRLQDTNKTFLFFKDYNWFMPELIVETFNYGNRTAKKALLNIQVVSPKARSVHSFVGEKEFYVLPKATLDKYYFPVIALEDKSFFLTAVKITWFDEFKRKIFNQKFYNKFVREKNNFYSSGDAEKNYIELVEQIISKPSKIVTSDPKIREYMYKVYNK